MFRNDHWYSRNQVISFPVDEAATGIDDAGLPLPSNIVVDLQLRFPLPAGTGCRLAAVSVSAGIVTAVFASGTTPVAAVSLPQPVDRFRQYALDPLLDGAAGWVTFGDGVDDLIPGQVRTHRFSTSAQSAIYPRCVRAVRRPAIPGIAASESTGLLSGLVSLKAESPLVLSRRTITIGGLPRNCLVFSLDASPPASQGQLAGSAGTLASLFTQESPLQSLAGPCGGRPESLTCGDPQPFQTFGGVSPDCSGVVTLNLGSGLNAYPYEDLSGFAISSVRTLDSVLPLPVIPDTYGYLPTSSLPAAGPSFPPAAPAAPAVTYPTVPSIVAGADLPFCTMFQGSLTPFGARAGVWTLKSEATEIPNPAGRCSGTPGVNSSSLGYTGSPVYYQRLEVAAGPDLDYLLLSITDATAIDRRVTAHVLLPTAATGPAGVLVNRRADTFSPDVNTHYGFQLDAGRQLASLVHFNGVETVTLASAAAVLATGVWYRIELSVTEGPTATSVYLRGYLESLTGPYHATSIGPLTVNGYYPSSGAYGLYAVGSAAHFGHLSVEAI